VTGSFRGIEFTMYMLSNTVAGADYVAVAGEDLVFHRGGTRVCHTIHIRQDNTCEIDSNEFFISGLANVRGVQIYIDPSTAQVVIDDIAEPECEYIMSFLVGQSHVDSCACKELRLKSDVRKPLLPPVSQFLMGSNGCY